MCTNIKLRKTTMLSFNHNSKVLNWSSFRESTVVPVPSISKHYKIYMWFFIFRANRLALPSSSHPDQLLWKEKHSVYCTLKSGSSFHLISCGGTVITGFTNPPSEFVTNTTFIPHIPTHTRWISDKHKLRPGSSRLPRILIPLSKTLPVNLW